METRILLSILVGIVANVVLMTAAYPQGATGVVKGELVGPSGQGVAQVLVVVSDESRGTRRTVSTDATGRFQVQLKPGTYALNTSSTGHASVTIKRMVVYVGEVIELTIPLEESAIEEVVAYGTADELMATATGETSLHITLDEVTRLPVARSIESVALLAPGTVPGVDAFGDDKTLVSFGGSSVAENVYYIDGLNVSNFRTGLGGSSVPFEFYDQFQIKTGGFSAEFGRSTGGVLNAVTRRGTNDFEYGVVAYVEPEWGQGSSPDVERSDGSIYDFNSKNVSSSTTTDIYVSGPVIKDRLFFFVLFEPQESSSDFNFRSASSIRIEEEIDDDFWGGNLTWNITDNHSLSYTTFTDERDISADVYDYDVDARQKGDLVGDSTKLRGGDTHIVSYEGQIRDNLVISARFGTNEYNLTDRSSNDIRCPAVTDFRDSSTNFFPGCWINGFITTEDDKRNAFRLDIEYFIGGHTIRAGFDREDNESFFAVTYTGLDVTPGLLGGAFYQYESWDVGQQLQNGAIMPDINGDGSRVDTVRFRYFESVGNFDTNSSAWYLEDTWDVSDALTLGLGIRNENFENFNGVGETYFDIKDQWAPRLALEWSPSGRGDQRIMLNWGRYHLPIMAFPNLIAGGFVLDYQRYFVDDGTRDPDTAAPTSVDADGVPTTQEIGSILVRADGNVPVPRSSLDTSLKPMYQDEWIVAYERDFGGNWSAGIRYVNRDLKSLIEDIEIRSVLADVPGFTGPTDFLQPCLYTMTNPGTDLTTFCDTNGNGELEEITIPKELIGLPRATRTYEAVDITFEKELSDRWSLKGSYTVSWNKGNTEGSVKSDNGQPDANLTEDYDFAQLMDGAEGYLPNDRRHKLRLWMSYELSERLSIGANLFAQSGRPINKFGQSHPDGPPPYGETYYITTDVGDPDVDGDETFEFNPRGTSGRTDWITQVDLAAIYSFDWGDTADVQLRAEVFNLFDSDGEQSVYEFFERRPDQFKLPTSYQTPRYFRFGAAIHFH